MSKVKLLLYCTKAKPYIGSHTEYNGEIKQENSYRVYTPHNFYNKPYYNGKIVAECDCEKVEEIKLGGYSDGENIVRLFEIETLYHNDLVSKSYLNQEQLEGYLSNEKGYALHLSNLKILDKPLAFDKDYIYKDYKGNELIKKAPQNMCRVYDRLGNKYILISIRPEWICKILNGEKTIEVRKQIIKELKELKENDKQRSVK